MARFALRVTTASALVLIAMSAASSALHPARAQESERSFGLFGLFNGSERLGGERGAPSGDGDRAAQVSGPDAVLRIERLESQIRQLTGTIEQLQFRNQQLESQIRRMQEEGAPRSAVQSRPQNPASPSAPPGKRGDAFDPSQNPNAPGAPHALGSMNAPAPVPSMSADASDQPVGAPAGRGAGAPLDVTAIPPPNGAVAGPSTRNAPAGGGVLATLPPSQTPRDEYDLAYGYMLRKDYALAEGAFRSFLGRYPNDRLVGDATYWLGESMFQRQRFRDAAEAFLDVSTKHESTAKAPDALLRLGQSLAALGEKEAACASLGEVLRKFPRASAGVKQGVEREQKRVHC